MTSVGWLVLIALGGMQLTIGVIGYLKATTLHHYQTDTIREVALINEKGVILYTTSKNAGDFAERWLMEDAQPLGSATQ